MGTVYRIPIVKNEDSTQTLLNIKRMFTRFQGVIHRLTNVLTDKRRKGDVSESVASL